VPKHQDIKAKRQAELHFINSQPQYYVKISSQLIQPPYLHLSTIRQDD